jgi:hypothetical protein
LNGLSIENGKQIPNDIKVESIDLGTTTAVGDTQSGLFTKVVVTLSKKTTPPQFENPSISYFSVISNELETFKRQKLFFAGRGIFLVGLIIEIVFYSIDVFAYISTLPKPNKVCAVKPQS